MVVIAFKLIVIFVDARAKWRSTNCEKIIILTQFEIAREKIINNKSWPMRTVGLEMFFFLAKLTLIFMRQRDKRNQY